VAYYYFCGVNLGVMHMGSEFNWKCILSSLKFGVFLNVPERHV